MSYPGRVLSTAMGAGLVLLSAWAAQAQSYTDPATVDDGIKGTMSIDFQTRLQFDTTGDVPEGSPAVGVTDSYAVDMEIMDSVLLQGNILRAPWLPTTILGRTYQEGYIAYDLRWSLRNPGNPAQTITLGGWIGAMSLDGSGLYRLAQPPEGRGPMRIAIDPVGNIPGFTSEFGGEIQGRIPEQAGLIGLADRASAQVTRTYARYVDGQVVQHTVEGADPMGFNSVVIAQGPVAAYPQTRVSGSIDYDSEEGTWYVDVQAAYSFQGMMMDDRFSGTIRWNEDPNRLANGLGWYEVNVRVNEQAVSEADIFQAAAPFSEDAFFSASATVPGFTGRISYTDKFEDESVVASRVTYEVDVNQVSRIQAMTFAKILLLMVGPFNDE